MIISLDELQTEYDDLKKRQQEFIHATGAQPSPMLILVAPEIDSLCSARILTSLLKSDLVQFVVRPVMHYQDIVDTTKQYLKDENIISIFMIGCGGHISLPESFTLESRVTIYVLDNHRPYHLSNVHSAQIRILHDSMDANITYPEWTGGDSDGEEEGMEDDDLDEVGPGMLTDEEDEDEDEEGEDLEADGSWRRQDGSEGLESDGSPSSKRRKRNNEKAALRKTKKAEQLAERKASRHAVRVQSRLERYQLRKQYERDLQKYYSGCSYGAASSVLMYELSVQLRKATNNELWLVMVGLADTFVHEKVEPSRYASIVAHLASQVPTYNIPLEQQARLLLEKTREAGSQASDALVVPVGHVEEVSEFRCPLLKHWSLYDALKYSPYTAARLQSWTEEGETKLKGLLTHVGVRTIDAQQLYKVMRQEEKQRCEAMLEEKAADHKYDIQYFRFQSFARQLTPTLQLSSCDMVYSLAALLEVTPLDHGKRSLDWKWEEGFWRGWKALEQTHGSESGILIQQGLTQAIDVQKLLFNTATIILPTKEIHSAGSFRYVTLPESNDSVFFARPMILAKLGFFLFEAGVALDDPVKKPLVLCSPIPNKGAHLVIAIMGTMSTPGVALKNSFGLKFQKAACPPLPEKEEEDHELDETEDERRARLIEGVDGGELALLRVKQEAFDQAVVEVQAEDLELFLLRLNE